MQHLLRLYLGFWARLIIRVHHPYIIGITGTVGKTTISRSVALMLQDFYGKKSVQYSPYHYNGEYGLPLTIIGKKSPGKNIFGWIWVGCVALSRIFRPYPRYLVLEYGIDHPGEMEFLLSIAIPDIAVVTEIAPNHIEQFGTFDRYLREKLLIVTEAHHTIAHESLREYIDRNVVYYSLGALSDIDASDLRISITGTDAVVHDETGDFPIHIPAIGSFQVENILPLYSIAHVLGLDPTRLAHVIARLTPEEGRSQILSGIQDTTIIDGSYNAGYLSLREGVSSMRFFIPMYRIIFFLGDMRELGAESEKLHEQLARDILDIVPHDADVSFFLVGPLMGEYVAPIVGQKFGVQSSLSARELGHSIADGLSAETPTIIYVKGSQNTLFLEEGIKAFLKNPQDASKLCRQSPLWLEKKEIFFAGV